MFILPMYLSTLMKSKWRHEALRNTSVRKIVEWHNCRPYWRLGPYFWVTAMRGNMTKPTGKSAKARLTIRALVAERSFLFITTANITKPFPVKGKCLMHMANINYPEESFKTNVRHRRGKVLTKCRWNEHWCDLQPFFWASYMNSVIARNGGLLSVSFLWAKFSHVSVNMRFTIYGLTKEDSLEQLLLYNKFHLGLF